MKSDSNLLVSAEIDAGLMRSALENASDAVYIFDDERRIIFVNAAACQGSGYTKTELLTMNIGDLDPDYPVSSRIRFRERAELGENAVFETYHLTKAGIKVPVEISLSTSIFNDVVYNSAFVRDITEAHELSSQLNYQASYDELTGLVNRREFEDRLQEVIEIANSRKSQNALCYLDLDQFKVINDTCGHMAGDELLRQLAQILFGCIRRDDTLARLGGDEFAILLENCPLENAEKVANNVRQVVQDFRFRWQKNAFNVGVSIGLTSIAQDKESISDVLRRADSACYAAKEAGRNRVQVFRFDDKELAHRHGEMAWVARINAALHEGRFELWQQKIAKVYKPGEPVQDGAADHFELLLRMRNDLGELILPDVFLPAAERYDLAPRVDRWVMKETFAWFEANLEKLESLGMCSINLSGQTLSDENFLHEVTSYLENSTITPEKICFEITETAAIANLSHATRFMNSLKSLGCSFALDDFGSGLSSFAYLKNLPVDFVKIDGFFVKGIVDDGVNLAMVKAINDMAHAMGKQTVAEFVENEEVLNEVIALGVDYVQGYGIAKPVALLKNSTGNRE